MAIITHMAPFPPRFKPRWRDILEKHVALYRRMPEELTLCVEELVPWFMDRTEWQWADWKGGKMPNAETAKVCVLSGVYLDCQQVQGGFRSLSHLCFSSGFVGR